MDKKLYLLFLWHQHQPYYKDPNGMFTMPWVFLHAIKDYYEMPWLLEKYDIKATFNLVPSLIVQLKEYEDINVNDRLFNLLRKNVYEWSKEDKQYAMTILFSANKATKIALIQRFAELEQLKEKSQNNDDFIDKMNPQDWLDLAVCFLLSWCGNAAREKIEIVNDLLEKEHNYSQSELFSLLVNLCDFVATIIPYHKHLQEIQKIEVSTTPYYHPILPILIDKNAATEAYGECIMPKNMADFTDDAPKHVQKAIDLYEKTFGKKPHGFWPAEGSVSKAALTLLAQKGIKWAASDEEILYKTIRRNDKFELYKKHFVQTSGNNIAMFFRDKKLSDAIGFSYSAKDPKEAANDFIQKLKEIYDNIAFSPLVPIILDGENAWEFYPNNAKDFFKHLYSALESADWIQTVTPTQAMMLSDVPVSELSNLQPGSWIYGTFSTWIGQSEKNRAWEMLSIAKKFVATLAKDTLAYEQIEQSLMIAEGSDWFWWYGDDHFTPLAHEFDALFRSRLIHIFKLAKAEVPQVLYQPICKNEIKIKYKKPSNYISPTIDGSLSDYYEWLGCGFVELGAELSAMDSSGFILQKLYWGFDEDALYLGLDGKLAPLIDMGYILILHFSLPTKYQITLPITSMPITRSYTIVDGVDVTITACASNYFEIKVDRVFKEEYRLIMLSFEIVKDGQLVERSPRYGALELEIGEKIMDDWFI